MSLVSSIVIETFSANACDAKSASAAGNATANLRTFFLIKNSLK